jgi:putative redox protein
MVTVVRLSRTNGLQFKVMDEHGHEMIIDTKKEFGGFDQGFRPAELMLVAQAGCMGMDVVGILQKKGGKIDKFTIEASGIRAEDHPHKYKKITVKMKCEGDYKREDLLRSFELSRDKYCSVTATLKENPELEFIVE